MKGYLVLMFTLLCFSLVAQEKKDVVIKTDVSEATVFIKGAQVVRKTTANFPAGRSTVRFTGLSPYIDAKSLQVKTEGDVMVLSVNYQLSYTDTLKQSAGIEQLSAQIIALNEKIKEENTTKEIIAEELVFMRENKKIGGTDGINAVNLKAASAYYSERISSLKTREMEVDRKIKVLSEERNSLERKLTVAGNIKPEPAGEVVMNIDCKAPVRIPVELSYYVNNAGWYPSYDIRAKNISEPVELTYKANVMQQTKEDWKNVRLKVSNLNPSLGNTVPRLKTYILDYYAKLPRYDDSEFSNQVKGRVMETSGESIIGASVMLKGTTIGTVSDTDGNFNLTVPSDGGELVISYLGFNTKYLPASGGFMNVVMEENTQMLEESVVVAYGFQKNEKSLDQRLAGKVAGLATTSVSKEELKKQKNREIPVPVDQVEYQTSVEFEINTPYTILSENKNMTIEMEHYTIPAEYEYYCVPKANKNAFLLANISNWEQYNLLEGEANIFFENTFVGKTILDMRSQSDTLNISLGRDKNVSVQREKMTDYTSRKFLGNKTETTRGWKITVRNNKSQPVSMVLLDQIPVSTSQEIEVNPENISGASLNNETGETKWKFTLKPSQKNELELKYVVKYPKGKTLTVE